MAIHLFSTPVECTNCGTVVDDPKVDRCPSCGELLKERRTPGRLAGVEKRYGNLRFLMGALRFLGVVIALVSVLAFVFMLGDVARLPQAFALLLGGIAAAFVIFTVVAFFDVAIDIEENTRAAFRLQQMILESVEEGSRLRAGESVPPRERAGP
jgi:predicted RNA-binding Zn-ribbon protein involved in translation (DUF1610 family)